ncbi:MAG: alanine--tRNA ligase-related protein, partial [Myxococcota bacterium]|nr:alanine--tRNA ligase-related protein [Myxococcota bacterium]
ELICEEHGVGIDHEGFEVCMNEQRERARAASAFGTGDLSAYQDLSEKGISTSFTGYDADHGTAQVLAMLVDGQRVPHVAAGQRVELVVAETPFYAESGGQMGDQGRLSAGADVEMAVYDVQRPFGEVVVHCGEVTRGSLSEGQEVHLQVDSHKRQSIRRNHSATHLLHHALREVLGEHVRQRGSHVGPERLRFDFSHTAGMTPEEMTRVEDRVNQMVLANEAVTTDLLTMDEAMERGAIAFFDEKYGDKVRVLSVGTESVELCGGTHARATGDIGLFKLVSEGAISSGVRRVEALTGLGAARWVQQRDALLKLTADRLHVSPDQVVERVDKLLDERKSLSAELESARTRLQLADAAQSLKEAREIGEHRLAVVRLQGVPGKELRPLGESLRDKLGAGAVLVVSVDQDKVSLLVAVTRDATERLHAGKLVGALAPMVGGRGGGRPDMAQAGGADLTGVDAAIDAFYTQGTEAFQA